MSADGVFKTNRGFLDFAIKLEEVWHRGHIRLYSAKVIFGYLSIAGLTPTQKEYFQYNEDLKSRLLYRLIPRQLYPSQLIIATKIVN